VFHSSWQAFESRGFANRGSVDIAVDGVGGFALADFGGAPLFSGFLTTTVAVGMSSSKVARSPPSFSHVT
jgi:hypothetical protein